MLIKYNSSVNILRMRLNEINYKTTGICDEVLLVFSFCTGSICRKEQLTRKQTKNKIRLANSHKYFVRVLSVRKFSVSTFCIYHCNLNMQCLSCKQNSLSLMCKYRVDKNYNTEFYENLILLIFRTFIGSYFRVKL